ncbi:Pleiotropic drug resistance protein 2 [Acorus calamus]|uniref:Pleiotropic drug resistance protein 2 n=1 Tax=Acorus calamus TaxID=4465 RepID=A0AAV9DGQ2_ACOCL|nr:Pleiotropic drug resistance protein 2 [Acorus calamus]
MSRCEGEIAAELGLSGSRGRSSRSFREVWVNAGAVFGGGGAAASVREDDEEDLLWAALERLPTYDRIRRGIVKKVGEDGEVVSDEVDIGRLGVRDREMLLGRIIKVIEDDNDRVGIELPKIEVRLENLCVEADVHVGSRALPTLWNATMNTLEGMLGLIRLSRSKKRINNILRGLSGILKPSRMTLLLGPPSSGKTTLLLALAGKLDEKLRACNWKYHILWASIVRIHSTENVRIHKPTRPSQRGNDGIKPDPEIDAFMKAVSLEGQETNLVTDYVLKLLGLDICADVIVGDEMRRGISGGQKKRVTTGEMLVGPAKALFMDEISTGLDSSTTFQMVKFIRQIVHVMDGTIIVSLLQPAPETFELFDDIILLSEGQIIYQGHRENVLEFFESIGFKCPERKGVADFLQEVTSKKDQEQYWFDKEQPYRYISVTEFANCFHSFHIGQRLDEELKIPYDRSKAHPAALAIEKYGISNWELFKACFAREWLLMKQLAMTVHRLPVFYKQRDFMFYPPWAFGLPIWFLAFFCTHQMALSLFRFIAAVGRTTVIANTFGTFALLVVFVLGGFVLSKDDIDPWWIWGYWSSPMMYGQNAVSINEFLDKRWGAMFVEEVMELVELNQLRDALVGLPGVDGLSTEQRKRLTIAVELVANPSIIFMDEPTSGLDARAAAIVMRTVRNTVDTGRTVVCTIHQPSIDIFEAFDELLLMKRGGQVIYAGSLGRRSHKLVEYFEAIPGVPKIRDGYNPATWMLEVTSAAVETNLDVDFAEIYATSSLYQRNQEFIKELSTPTPGSKDLYFPTKYSQSFTIQCLACFWKQHLSYWRHPQYNAVRFFMTIVIGVMFGTIFWNKGKKLEKQQDLFNTLGAMYAAVLFLGATNATTVQPVVSIERTVFYRERAAGMYSALPYAFAQVCIEIIYIAAQTLVYSFLLFSMIGFSWKATNFFWFLFFIFMCFIYFTMYGMMVVALTPNYQIAAITMSFFLSFWNLFSGFLISRPLIPIWWRWYYWASPVAWTLYGLIVSQVGDREDMLQIPGQDSKPVKEFLKDYFGFKHDFLGAVAGAHFAFVFVFFFVFAYGIKFLNFQRR